VRETFELMGLAGLFLIAAGVEEARSLLERGV
jgi:hypothetical protein